MDLSVIYIIAIAWLTIEYIDFISRGNILNNIVNLNLKQ